MATNKSYTDLSQSKVLAEILPLESADMVLLHEEPYETSDSMFDGLHQALCVPFSKYDKSWRQKYRNISYFPCWSLSALLNIINTINGWYPGIDAQVGEDNLWQICMFSYETGSDLSTAAAKEELVDTCYEVILKLKEKGLL